jgi:hypothetical protein
MMSEYQREKMKRAQLDADHFILQEKDTKGNNHCYLNYNAISHFMDDEDSLG